MKDIYEKLKKKEARLNKMAADLEEKEKALKQKGENLEPKEKKMLDLVYEERDKIW